MTEKNKICETIIICSFALYVIILGILIHQMATFPMTEAIGPRLTINIIIMMPPLFFFVAYKNCSKEES